MTSLQKRTASGFVISGMSLTPVQCRDRNSHIMAPVKQRIAVDGSAAYKPPVITASTNGATSIPLTTPSAFMSPGHCHVNRSGSDNNATPSGSDFIGIEYV